MPASSNMLKRNPHRDCHLIKKSYKFQVNFNNLIYLELFSYLFHN